MNAAGTRAPKAAGAEGTRLASGEGSRPSRRGWPEESQAAAPRGGSEWPAVGAQPRFLPAPPPRPHPATTPGPALGCLRRRRWAALLVFGLLVAGAADGCELVPRNLRGRRASGSAAAAASSPASAAGDSPALLTGEGQGSAGGARPVAAGPPSLGGARGRPPFDCPGQCAMPSRTPGRQCQCPGCCFVAVPYTPDAFPLPAPPADTSLWTESVHGTRLSAFSRALRCSTLSVCGAFPGAAEEPAGSAGHRADIFFLSC